MTGGLGEEGASENPAFRSRSVFPGEASLQEDWSNRLLADSLSLALSLALPTAVRFKALDLDFQVTDTSLCTEPRNFELRKPLKACFSLDDRECSKTN